MIRLLTAPDYANTFSRAPRGKALLDPQHQRMRSATIDTTITAVFWATQIRTRPDKDYAPQSRSPNMVHVEAQPSRAFLSVSQRRKLRQADNVKAISSSSPGAAKGRQFGTSDGFHGLPTGGLEPPHPCELRILSPLRLPFRQAGQDSAF